MRKIACALFALILIAFYPKAAYAADIGHVIEKWHTEAYYKANNVIEVTETISVNFTQPRHGFFRVIPYVVKIEKQTENALEDYSYRIRINDVNVKGAAFDVSREDQVTIIKIGDEDVILTGMQSYEVTYTLDIGDDRIDLYDEIFFTVLGADNTALVKEFSFNVTFEKPLPENAQTQLFSESYGSTSNDGINYNITPTSITGSTIRPFDTGEAVTIHSRLPEGYFTNERIISPFPLYIVLIIGLAVLVGIILTLLKQKRATPIVTVEFSAPDGISSAEVGYILDACSDNKDILSLIIWFAGKGYLTISGEESNAVLHKAKPLPESCPSYMTTFFNGLFADGDDLELAKADHKIYEKLQLSMQLLSHEFSGERKLYSSKSIAYSVLVPLLALLPCGYGLLMATDFISTGASLSAVFSIVLLIVAMLVGVASSFTWTFAGMASRAALAIGRLAPIAIAMGISVIISVSAVTGFSFAPTVILGVYSAIMIFAPMLTYPTKYYTQVSGKLLGLRNFIKLAELERLEMLVKDNPQYYYDILPYAYVFNLTDVWAKQFETLTIPPPQYCTGTMPISSYNMYWLIRGMNYSYQKMGQDMAAQAAKSGGGGGTSFGGGGGFSGGGFGGGGSGSW